MSIVLIGRSHIDLESGYLGLVRERADDIVCFKARHFQYRNVHRLQELFDDRNGLADVFRCLWPLGFVLLEGFMTEGRSLRIEGHAYVGRFDLAQEVIECDGKAEDC